MSKLFLIVILFLFCSCVQKSEDSIYILPKEYEGNILIVFDQSNGMEIEQKDNSRIYKIPKNGVLKVRIKPKFGVGKISFYQSTIEQQNEISYINSSDWDNITNKQSKVVCWNLETGSDSDSNNKKRHFEVFSVGRVSKSDSISDARSAFVWKYLK
jgi:hypothetical protein